jgi:hypothetical protein
MARITWPSRRFYCFLEMPEHHFAVTQQPWGNLSMEMNAQYR